MKRILIIGIAAFFIFIPLAASAQVPPLVPECGVYGENGFGPYCQACDLLKLANRLIDFGVYLAIIIATLMFTYAGVLYVTAASQSGAGAIDKAKKIFWSVFWGLVIVLSSWLAINVLLSVFTGNGLAFWSEIRCVEFAEVYDSQGNLSISPWVPIKPKPLPEGAIDHKTAILQLTAAGIDVRSTSGVVAANCQGPCTSLERIQQSVIDQVIAIKQACGCNVTVTGGTEEGAGHTSGEGHLEGIKVDIDDTPTVDSFLEEALTPQGDRNGDPRYRDSCGNVYVREDNHWDILVVGSCPLGG